MNVVKTIIWVELIFFQETSNFAVSLMIFFICEKKVKLRSRVEYAKIEQQNVNEIWFSEQKTSNSYRNAFI